MLAVELSALHKVRPCRKWFIRLMARLATWPRACPTSFRQRSAITSHKLNLGVSSCLSGRFEIFEPRISSVVSVGQATESRLRPYISSSYLQFDPSGVFQANKIFHLLCSTRCERVRLILDFAPHRSSISQPRSRQICHVVHLIIEPNSLNCAFLS